MFLAKLPLVERVLRLMFSKTTLLQPVRAMCPLGAFKILKLLNTELVVVVRSTMGAVLSFLSYLLFYIFLMNKGLKIYCKMILAMIDHYQ